MKQNCINVQNVILTQDFKIINYNLKSVYLEIKRKVFKIIYY